MREIAVANHAEFNRASMWKFPSGQKRAWDEGAGLLADQALFWGCCGGGEKTVISPRLPHPAMAEDIKMAMGLTGLEIIVPCTPTPFVTRPEPGGRDPASVLAEKSGGEALNLTAWGMTHGLAALLNRLRERGVRVRTPDLPPPELLPLVQSLDSKSGARLFLERHGIPVPEACPVSGVEDAVAVARHFLEKGWGAAVKANRGTGGFGVRIYRSPDLEKNPGRMARDLEMRIRMGEYWSSRPLIVERLVEDAEGNVLSPTTDWRVTGEGEARCLGTGLMRIARNTFYEGIDAGRGVMAPGLKARCEEIGGTIAGILGAMGYRGWFDADFVVDAGGKPLVTELNMRRSSPSHAYDLARARFGEEWMEKTAVRAVDRVGLEGAGEGLDYGRIRPAFRSFNEEMESGGLFAVPQRDATGGEGRAPSIGYILLAPDGQSALEASGVLEKKILQTAGCGPWK